LQFYVFFRMEVTDRHNSKCIIELDSTQNLSYGLLHEKKELNSKGIVWRLNFVPRGSLWYNLLSIGQFFQKHY
jgi:hypothetical protein